jgi:uncharacterized membrane protein YedE/YeeE
MNIVIEPAVWLQALAGGALIGAAATLMLLFNGRIAGVSGVLGGLVLDRNNAGERAWRGLFLAGLVLGALLYAQVGKVPVPASASARAWARAALPVTASAGWQGFPSARSRPRSASWLSALSPCS